MLRDNRGGMAKKKTAEIPPKLTEGERDLLSQLEHGYQLETNSLGANPVFWKIMNSSALAT